MQILSILNRKIEQTEIAFSLTVNIRDDTNFLTFVQPVDIVIIVLNRDAFFDFYMFHKVRIAGFIVEQFFFFQIFFRQFSVNIIRPENQRKRCTQTPCFVL